MLVKIPCFCSETSGNSKYQATGAHAATAVETPAKPVHKGMAFPGWKRGSDLSSVHGYSSKLNLFSSKNTFLFSESLNIINYLIFAIIFCTSYCNRFFFVVALRPNRRRRQRRRQRPPHLQPHQHHPSPLRSIQRQTRDRRHQANPTMDQRTTHSSKGARMLPPGATTTRGSRTVHRVLLIMDPLRDQGVTTHLPIATTIR